MNSHVLLESYCKALKLPTVAREYGRLARQCGEENRGYAAFLEAVLELEVQHRQAKAVARRIKAAGFPAEKELSGFDFAAIPKLNRKRMLELATCPFRSGPRSSATSASPGRCSTA